MADKACMHDWCSGDLCSVSSAGRTLLASAGSYRKDVGDSFDKVYGRKRVSFGGMRVRICGLVVSCLIIFVQFVDTIPVHCAGLGRETTTSEAKRVPSSTNLS